VYLLWLFNKEIQAIAAMQLVDFCKLKIFKN